jgi:hypothetical protein
MGLVAAAEGAVMTTILVNLFAALFWAIAAVLWWISSGPPGASLESLASELQIAAYYSKWAAIAADATR